MESETDTMTSTKPYLIRAIYEWILDNDMTPHLVVDVRYPGVQAPKGFVEDERLVLNLSPSAVRALVLGNEQIEFNARFGGVARDVYFPVEAVLGIFTRENGQGMVFPELAYPLPGEPAPEADSAAEVEPKRSKPGSVGRPRGIQRPQGSEGPKSPSGKGKGKGGGPTLKVVK
ncbi:MAG: ClpXP protease specificity-enhancing factor [Thiocapsa sp. C3-sup]